MRLSMSACPDNRRHVLAAFRYARRVWQCDPRPYREGRIYCEIVYFLMKPLACVLHCH
jgi:hypothetical protein